MKRLADGQQVLPRHSATDPKVANAATAAAVVPRRVCLTTGASVREQGWSGVMTRRLADDAVPGAGRLLPRVGVTPSLLMIAVSRLTFTDAGGAHDGQSRLHLAAVDSCTSNTCLLGGMLLLR